MKNKLFLPIIIVSLIIMLESVLLLTARQGQKTKTMEVNTVTPGITIVEDAISFGWQNEGNKAILVMKANKGMSIDAIDLYVAYKNTKVKSANNLNVLPKPTFSKVSTEQSLVVMNYLIPEVEGFKLAKGQSVSIAEFDLIPNSTGSAELSIDAKTQVVENGTSKVLPFNSKNLIVNGTSL